MIRTARHYLARDIVETVYANPNSWCSLDGPGVARAEVPNLASACTPIAVDGLLPAFSVPLWVAPKLSRSQHDTS